MPVIFWVFTFVIVLMLASALGLSFYFTRRSHLGEVHTPDEYGMQFEPVEFKANDGIILRGVWIPCEGSDKAVLFLHGYDCSHDLEVYLSPALHDAGFNLLFFDFRAHGRSEGNRKSFGYEERRDVLGAIDFLKKLEMQHIGVYGTSYGGLIAILTAPICPDIEAVISDGGPTRLMTGAAAWAMERNLPLWLTTLMAWLFFNMTSLRLGANIFHYGPIRWVGKISPRPIFFIHGDLDLYCADFDDLYTAANQPKELWRLPEAGHTTASKLYPEEHMRRVIDFFRRYL